VRGLVIFKELSHSPLVELPFEERKLTVEVSYDDDSCSVVAFKKIFHQRQDLIRPLGDIGVVDRFEVAGEDVKRDILEWDAGPVKVCPQGLNLLGPQVVGCQKATTLSVFGRLGDLLARQPQIPGEVGLAEGEDVRFEDCQVSDEYFHLLKAVESACVVVDHVDLHLVEGVAAISDSGKTQLTLALLELSSLGCTHEGCSLLPPLHDVGGGVAEAVQAKTPRSWPRDCGITIAKSLKRGRGGYGSPCDLDLRCMLRKEDLSHILLHVGC